MTWPRLFTHPREYGIMRIGLAVSAVILIVGLIATPAAIAESPSLPEAQSTLTCGSGDHYVDYATATGIYNNNTDAIPSPIKPVIQSNTSELQIENASQEYYTITTDDSMKITSVSLGTTSEEDVKIVTDRDTACSLYTAADPVSTFTQAYADGDIEIESKGVVKSTVTYVVKKVVELFGS